MTVTRRSLLAMSTAAAGLSLLPRGGRAQSAFPSRSIRIVVPYGAGGGSDLTARVLAEGMQKVLNTPIVVENRAGANGQIAASEVMGAEHDGHTILFAGSPNQVTLPLVEKELQVSPPEAFRIVTNVSSYYCAVIVGPDSGLNTMDDLVGRIRDPAANVTYVALGPLTTTDLSSLAIGAAAGGKVAGVVYKGAPQGQLDVIANRVTFQIDSMNVQKAVREGRVKALAVLAPQRVPELPDVPTIAEAGLPEAMVTDWLTWNGLFVPKDVPDDVVNTLNAAAVQAAATSEVLGKFADLGITNMATTSADEAQAEWLQRIEDWRPAVEKLGLVKS